MMFGIGQCGQCQQPFTFNPSFVPSSRNVDGTQNIFCRTCVEQANVTRQEMNLEPFFIHPEAYAHERDTEYSYRDEHEELDRYIDSEYDQYERDQFEDYYPEHFGDFEE